MIQQQVALYLLTFVRVAAFVGFLPIFSGRRIPRTVKIALALALSIAWVETVQVPDIDPLLQSWREASWFRIGLRIVREISIGSAIGFAFGMLFEPARIAGSYICQEMGLTMATTADPAADSSTNVVGTVFEALATLMFFALDLHHTPLYAMKVSLERLPLATTAPI